jgi:hypothetical protein
MAHTAENLFVVKESDLVRLLANEAKLIALVQGGVDNWEWFSDSLGSFLHEFAKGHRELVDEEDVDFNIIGMSGLVDYKTLEDLIMKTEWEV